MGYVFYKHRAETWDSTIDTLEEAYDKIARDRWADIRTYHSDIYYITHLVNHEVVKDPKKFLRPQEINELLYEEGLLKWSEYVPQKYVARMSRINFKPVNSEGNYEH